LWQINKIHSKIQKFSLKRFSMETAEATRRLVMKARLMYEIVHAHAAAKAPKHLKTHLSLKTTIT
jgi:hypothetical protein